MLNIELIGGPHDGWHMSLGRETFDLLDRLPREIAARWTPLDSPEPPGRYVVTRKLTKRGRLIYEWSTLR